MSEHIKKVLAAVDCSAAAAAVLSTAVALGRVLDAEAVALHVSEDGERTAASTARRLGVAYLDDRGDPFDRIVARAAPDDVVAVVVGARALTGGHLGHLASRLADALDKPVVVVPPDAAGVGVVRRVLVAMEGTPGRARAVKAAVEVAAGGGLDLFVVHVDDEDHIPSFSDQVAHETEAYADSFLARFAPGAGKAKLELRVGRPADQVLKACDELGVDLVAVGWPHSSDPARGAVAREIVDRSRVPVLLVALAE